MRVHELSGLAYRARITSFAVFHTHGSSNLLRVSLLFGKLGV